jgi:aspartate/methionine/tyrosine aminotransferase
VFSSRIPDDLAPNRLARLLEQRRAMGHEVLDLTESNPTQACFDYPPHLLEPLALPHGLGYRPRPLGAPGARQAVARQFERRGVLVPPERIVLTTGASESYSLLFKLLADPCDEVLVPRPSYPLFDHLTRLECVVPRAYDLDYDSGWAIDFESLERGWTSRTRAVLLVSPNNPTGSFVKRAELDRLAALCAERDAAIVADEVFADYELEPGATAEAGLPAARNDALAFSLGGLSKSGGLPQLKLGWIAVAGPEALARSALERLELVCDTYLSVSTPVQEAAADLLAAGSAIRMQIAERVTRNYRRVRGQTTESTSACRVLRADAGWYVILQVPRYEPEEDLVCNLLTSRGVLVHPGYFFDFQRESFLVASLLTPDGIFAEGFDRILRHFGCSSTLRT